MDTLPAVITTCTARLDRLSVTRFLDASRRRPGFQRKIGLGLTLEEFNSMLSRGEITSHVGLSESVLLISSMLGLKVEEVKEEQTLILAEEDMELNASMIRRGRVRGVAAVGMLMRRKKDDKVGVRGPGGHPRSGVRGDQGRGGAISNLEKRRHCGRPGYWGSCGEHSNPPTQPEARASDDEGPGANYVLPASRALGKLKGEILAEQCLS